MELLVWHEALGCDDEQASEHELLARVLYAYSTSSSSGGGGDGEGDSASLQTLHFVQGLLAFVRMLKRSDRRGDDDDDAIAAATVEGKQSPSSTHHRRSLEWVSVTLSKRRFFVQEVEPQIYIALKEHRFIYKALMRDLYSMFCLLHGRIDSNLRQLPTAATHANEPNHSEQQQGFTDGMELLLAIQATRKRIRKLEIVIESCQQQQQQSEEEREGRDDHHEAQDNTLSRLEEDKAQSQRKLETLLAMSPRERLEKRCAAFFPTLLHALDASHASSFHELVGMGQLPVDQATFLSLQSFLNAFSLELSDTVDASAIFFKGNLLWSNMDTSILQLLYRFLRLREEHGMEMEPNQSGGVYMKPVANHRGDRGVWMDEKYRDTFLPVWSSKTSYAECTVVNHARRHPRKTVRSLHKQTPSPLAAVVSDANGTPHSSSNISSSSSSHKSATAANVDDHELSHVRALSKSVLKARIKSVSYRNTGLLMQNGYFAKTFELPIKSRGRGKFSESEAVDFIWKPRVFAANSSSDPTEESETQESDRCAILWHESDLSMLILVKHQEQSEKTAATDSNEQAARVLKTLSGIEDAMDRLKFHELAKLLLSQSSSSSTSSSRGGSSSPAYPFVYLNRADGTFKARGIPRLIKCKEDDLFPPPLRLLANYLPQQTLTLLDLLHCELQKCGHGETRDACVKTLHDGWVLGKKSHLTQREFFAFFDTKVPAVADLSDALEDLLQDQFGNVFF